MMARQRHSGWAGPARQGRQRGLALFISLVVLLIITIIGISGVQTTVLEERMAANARDHDLAFQAAEAALLEAEVFVEALDTFGGPDFDANQNGYYLPADAGNPPRWETVDWGSAEVVTADAVPGTAAPPRYIIERVTTIIADEGRLNIGNVDEQIGAVVTVFRVTARGSGGSATANVLLQSTYGKVL